MRAGARALAECDVALNAMARLPISMATRNALMRRLHHAARPWPARQIYTRLAQGLGQDWTYASAEGSAARHCRGDPRIRRILSYAKIGDLGCSVTTKAKRLCNRSAFWQKLYLPEILRGMAVTTRHFVTNVFGRRHTVTQQYPEEPTYVSERYRGRHRLMRKEDGAPRCTSCMLCATSCPALCIHIQAGEHPVSYA